MKIFKTIVITGIMLTLTSLGYTTDSHKSSAPNSKEDKAITRSANVSPAKAESKTADKEAVSSHNLDEQNLQGTITKDGNIKGKPDTIELSHGKFLSAACQKYGMNWSTYTTEKLKDGSVKFKAVVHSTKSNMGTMHWQGVIKSGSATASMNWTTKDKKVEKVTKYTFQTKRK